MKNRMFLVAVLGMLVFSLVVVNVKPGKDTIHVQTLGYERRDLLKLTVDITGEDSDYLYISVKPGVINRVSKEINSDMLPVVQLTDTTFKYLRRI